jgi:transposase
MEELRHEQASWQRRISDRAALTGILVVLKSGILWEMLPPEMGCGRGATCWRLLRDWQAAGVWGTLHRTLLDRLGEADRWQEDYDGLR